MLGLKSCPKVFTSCLKIFTAVFTLIDIFQNSPKVKDLFGLLLSWICCQELSKIWSHCSHSPKKYRRLLIFFVSFHDVGLWSVERFEIGFAAREREMKEQWREKWRSNGERNEGAMEREIKEQWREKVILLKEETGMKIKIEKVC